VVPHRIPIESRRGQAPLVECTDPSLRLAICPNLRSIALRAPSRAKRAKTWSRILTTETSGRGLAPHKGGLPHVWSNCHHDVEKNAKECAEQSVVRTGYNYH